MDCPGLYDTKKTEEEIATVIVQAVACTHPGPHAILYIIRLGRYTQEDFGVYNRLKALFDDAITRYMILIFTGGDELEDAGSTLEDLIREAPADLTTVIEECGNRCIVFNNKARNPKPQVDRLLEQVRNIKAHNDQEYYKCPKYNRIGEGLEAEVQKRLTEMKVKELEWGKDVQKLEAGLKEDRKAVKKAHAEMEEKIKVQQRRMEKEFLKLKMELESREIEMDMERKKFETEHQQKLTEQMEQQQYKHEQEIEKMQRREEERIKRLEQQHNDLERKRQEEQKEQRRQQRAYKAELDQLKEAIAKNEKGWLAKLGRGVVSLVTAPFKLFR